MQTATTMLIELIGRLGYRVAVARDHVEALNLETGARFIVRGEDLYEMADASERVHKLLESSSTHTF